FLVQRDQHGLLDSEVGSFGQPFKLFGDRGGVGTNGLATLIRVAEHRVTSWRKRPAPGLAVTSLLTGERCVDFSIVESMDRVAKDRAVTSATLPRCSRDRCQSVRRRLVCSPKTGPVEMGVSG